MKNKSPKPPFGPPTRLQSVRDFTVQIRHSAEDYIVGTGVVVSADGKIVTCGHVVLDAGVNPRIGTRVPSYWTLLHDSIFGQSSSNLSSGDIIVYFPQVKEGNRLRRARVVAYLADTDDDVVLLHLTDGPCPIRFDQVAILGGAESSAGHDFRTYGYRRLERYQGLPGTGTIIDFADKPQDRVLMSDPVVLASQHIDSGMSGAAVLDTERNLVVGIVAETWDSTRNKDRDTAFAVDCAVLGRPPFGLPIREAPLPLMADYLPQMTNQPVLASRASWNDAPKLPDKWIPRTPLLAAMDTRRNDSRIRVLSLTGFGGTGKSTLCRYWAEAQLAKGRFSGVFWWTFSPSSVGRFFEEAFAFCYDRLSAPSSIAAQSHFVAAAAYNGRLLFILDGLEAVQSGDGDNVGVIKSPDLKEFLGYFALPHHASFCLLSTRYSPFELATFTSYCELNVGSLSDQESAELLRSSGIDADRGELNAITRRFNGHALSLVLAGTIPGMSVGLPQHGLGRDADTPTLVSGFLTTDEGASSHSPLREIMNQSDGVLTAAEIAVLEVASVCRRPIQKEWLEVIFQGTPERAFRNSLPLLSSEELDKVLARLEALRLVVRREEILITSTLVRYGLDPLVRDTYSARLEAHSGDDLALLHNAMSEMYVGTYDWEIKQIAIDASSRNMEPLIEAFHHKCMAGRHDEAWQYFLFLTNGTGALTWKRGDYQTVVDMLQHFFSKEQAKHSSDRLSNRMGAVCDWMALAMTNLGRLSEGIEMTRRALAEDAARPGEVTAPEYSRLAQIHCYRAELSEALSAASKAVALSEEAIIETGRTFEIPVQSPMMRQLFNKGKVPDHITALSAALNAYELEGWIYLLGEHDDQARTSFNRAEEIARELRQKDWGFTQTSETFYRAEYYFRTGRSAEAERVVGQCLDLLEPSEAVPGRSRAYILLGKIQSAARHKSKKSTEEYFSEALRLAQTTSIRPLQIEAFQAFGSWLVGQRRRTLEGMAMLEQALSYAISSGFAIAERDVRWAIAYGLVLSDQLESARNHIETVIQIQSKMGIALDTDPGKVLKQLVKSRNGKHSRFDATRVCIRETR